MAIEWLPPMLPTNGDFSQVLADLFEVFNLDFKFARRTLNGYPVWWNRKPVEFGGLSVDDCFHHLITREDKPRKDRLWDSWRAERLPWCGPLLSHATDPSVKCWSNAANAGQRPRTTLWLEEEDFALILERRPTRNGDVYFLITAYHLDGASSREGFRQRYENRIADCP